MNLDQALKIAIEAHSGQNDIGGESYILHPIRVMLRMHTLEERIVAILHDVIEDTEVTEDYLLERGLETTSLLYLRHLTRESDIFYQDYIATISEYPLARKVKIADLEDNMNFIRLRLAGDVPSCNLERHLWAYRYLTEKEPSYVGSLSRVF